ncbi:MAG: hypothetical protein M0027_08995 [Candidatus Dormibacteraeota bacterium]|jgi:hypothetical protein|nr:hypothetical protein [Candidatus Dormibacteraeota bacterium]
MDAPERGSLHTSIRHPGMDWAEAVRKLAAELRRRADGPGVEGMVADGLLQLLHVSAQVMTDCGMRLEEAITPPRMPRARRASPRRNSSRPTRTHRIRPDA